MERAGEPDASGVGRGGSERAGREPEEEVPLRR